jgi:hypothetical protein
MRFLLNLRTLIVAVVCSFSYITVLTVVAQWGQWSFYTYTLCALSGVLLSVVTLYALRQRWDLVDLPFFGSSQFEIPLRHSVYIGAIALGYGIIAVFAVRPNPDDYYSYANAFYAYTNPDQHMSHVVHSILPISAPYVSARWATSGPYEYFVAALALTVPMQFLTWVYICLPLFHGVFFALVLYYGIVVLYGNFRYALHGFIAAALVLLILGDSQYGPLHVSLLRFAEAETVFIASAIPLFLVESYVLLRSPRLRNLLIVTMILVASIGLTTSGYLLILMVNCIVAVAVLSFVTNARLQHPQWILLWINESSMRVVMLLCSTLPVLGYSVWLQVPGSGTPTTTSLPKTVWPVDFWGQVALLQTPLFPFTTVLIGATVVIGLFVLRPRLRRLVVLFYAALILGYLNPLVAPRVIQYITQPNTYWQMFYLAVPLLLIGVVSASASRFLRYQFPRWRQFALMFAVLCYVAVLSDSPSSLLRQTHELSSERIAEAGLERALWKVSLPDYAVAEKVSSIAPPGPMLAPEVIAGPMVVISAQHPQLAVRSEAELFWADLEQNREQMTARVQSAVFLDGHNQNNRSFLESELRAEAQRIRTIVVRSTVYQRSDVRTLLDSYAFEQVGMQGLYTILVRTPDPK